MKIDLCVFEKFEKALVYIILAVLNVIFILVIGPIEYFFIENQNFISFD